MQHKKSPAEAAHAPWRTASRTAHSALRSLALALAAVITTSSPHQSATGAPPTAASSPAQDQTPCTVTRLALSQVLTIRGLTRTRDVPCLVSTRSEIEHFLQQTMKTKLPAHKIEMEQLVYRTIGMIPDEYDYASGIVALYLSQIGGYYDPEQARLVLAGWIPAALQTTVVVHELTHALQDQHFDLNQLIDPKNENGDEVLARAALIEGDATAVMTDYIRKLTGSRPLQHERNIDTLLLQQVLASGIGSDTGGTPPAIRALLLFPYTSGLRFVHRLLQHGGYAAVNQALENPPKSSRDILHPEKYLAGTAAPQLPALSELSAAHSGLTPIYSDTLGEFGISALLHGELSNQMVAAEAAAGWAGDRLAVFQGVNQEITLVWKTRWERTTDAREFLEGYQEFLTRRYPGATETRRDNLRTISTTTKEITISHTADSVDLRFTLKSPVTLDRLPAGGQ